MKFGIDRRGDIPDGSPDICFLFWLSNLCGQDGSHIVITKCFVIMRKNDLTLLQMTYDSGFEVVANDSGGDTA